MSKDQFIAVLDRVRDAVSFLPEDVDGFAVTFGRFVCNEGYYPDTYSGIVVEIDTADSELVYRFPVPDEPRPAPKAKAKK